MNITLGKEFERRITQRVESGLYTSASEVIRDSLRLLFDKDVLKERQQELLQQEVIKGFRQLEQGEYTELGVDELFKKAVKESNVC
jgi:antitoxin ParD1/3/4